MKTAIPEIKCFDNAGKEMKSKKKILSIREYLMQFNLQYLKGSKAKDRHSQFSCFH